MAQHLTPEQHQFNEEVFQFKQESEKEILEDVDVLHHHNADHQPDCNHTVDYSQHDATLRPDPSSDGPGQAKVDVTAYVAQGSAAPEAENLPNPMPSGPVKESKEVTEKLAAVSLAASAKVSGAAKRV